MTSNPARQARRASRFGQRQPTRMTEYQRDRQAEAPSSRLKVHAHLHNLDLNVLAEYTEPGVFEGVACEVDGCGEAIEWNEDLGVWQHHATRLVRCAGDRGIATPPPEEDDDGQGDDDDEVLDEARALTRREAREAYLAAHGLTKPPRVDGNPYTTEFARGVLLGLQDKPTYQGTVQVDEVSRRRLHNRDAKRARRLMRKARVKRSRSRRHGAA